MLESTSPSIALKQSDPPAFSRARRSHTWLSAAERPRVRSAILALAVLFVWFPWFVVVVGRLYRQLLPAAWTSAIAGAMFALDAAHGGTAGWLVNRSALMGAVFTILALSLHHRQRSGEGLRFGFGAWACFALALLSAELSLGILGYLVAYALFLERCSWLRRVASLAPYAPRMSGLGDRPQARRLWHFERSTPTSTPLTNR